MPEPKCRFESLISGLWTKFGWHLDCYRQGTIRCVVEGNTWIPFKKPFIQLGRLQEAVPNLQIVFLSLGERHVRQDFQLIRRFRRLTGRRAWWWWIPPLCHHCHLWLLEGGKRSWWFIDFIVFGKDGWDISWWWSAPLGKAVSCEDIKHELYVDLWAKSWYPTG